MLEIEDKPVQAAVTNYTLSNQTQDTSKVISTQGWWLQCNFCEIISVQEFVMKKHLKRAHRRRSLSCKKFWLNNENNIIVDELVFDSNKNSSLKRPTRKAAALKDSSINSSGNSRNDLVIDSTAKCKILSSHGHAEGIQEKTVNTKKSKKNSVYIRQDAGLKNDSNTNLKSEQKRPLTPRENICYNSRLQPKLCRVQNDLQFDMKEKIQSPPTDRVLRQKQKSTKSCYSSCNDGSSWICQCHSCHDMHRHISMQSSIQSFDTLKTDNCSKDFPPGYEFKCSANALNCSIKSSVNGSNRQNTVVCKPIDNIASANISADKRIAEAHSIIASEELCNKISSSSPASNEVASYDLSLLFICGMCGLAKRTFLYATEHCLNHVHHQLLKCISCDFLATNCKAIKAHYEAVHSNNLYHVWLEHMCDAFNVSTTAAGHILTLSKDFRDPGLCNCLITAEPCSYFYPENRFHHVAENSSALFVTRKFLKVMKHKDFVLCCIGSNV